jgi:hypothetical protein
MYMHTYMHTYMYIHKYIHTYIQTAQAEWINASYDVDKDGKVINSTDGITEENKQRNKARENEMLNACNTYPEHRGHCGSHEFVVNSANKGDATSFVAEEIEYSPIHCSLVRTRTVEQVVQMVKSYDYEGIRALLVEGMLSFDSIEAKMFCARITNLRVLSGDQTQ